jgi:hypothetical protein
MSGLRIEGNVSGNVAEVNDSNQIKVVPETDAAANPENVGAVRFFSENDSGEATGTPYLASPETDDDYRLRVGADTLLDIETFNYTAQNTGKHTYASSTLTITYSTSGLTTNGSGITTTGTAATWGTYAEFPILGSTNTFLEFEASFSNAVVSNFSLDFGLFRRGGSSPYAPTDGVFFRLNASGLFGVISYNGAETPTPAFTFSYTDNHKYQFIIALTQRGVEFWIDNVRYGSIKTPSGQGQPFLSATLPVSIRHANTGTTSAVLQMNVNNYSLSVGGSVFNRSLSELGNAALGSYQGLSGGTMGSLAFFANSSNPTAAVPTNTTSTVLNGYLSGDHRWYYLLLSKSIRYGIGTR